LIRLRFARFNEDDQPPSVEELVHEAAEAASCGAESGDSAERHRDAPVALLYRLSGSHWAFVKRTPEIFVEGVQGIGFKLAEGPAQFALDPVNGVEEVATIHIQPPGAELPVRAQQEVEAEEPVVFLIEYAAAY